MVIPFTLAGLVRARGWRRAGYGAALALQLLAFITTQSRGPAVGLAAGLAVFAGLMLWPRYRLKLLAGLIVLPLLAGLAWAALNSGLAPAEKVSEIGFVRRATGQVSEASRTVRVRVVLWQAAVELIRERPSIGFEPDRWQSLRPWIGYGVDTAAVVYTYAYPPELAHIENPSAVWDRAHNQTLDIIVMKGWLGLAAVIGLGAAVIRQGWLAWKRAESTAGRALVAAPLAALAAHVVEIQFAFSVTTTMMMAWLCVALIGSFEGSIDRRETEVTEENKNRGWLGRLAAGALAFLLLLTAVRVEGGAFAANLLAGDGRRLDRAGQWQQSIEKYDQAIALVPWQAAYYQFRGEAFYNLARVLPLEQTDVRADLLAAADRSLGQARRQEPLEMEYYANSGLLHAYWSDTVDPAHLATAVAFYEQAFQLAPTRVELRRDLGHVFHNQGNYTAALGQYESGLVVDPAYAPLYQDAALAYEAMGETEKAAEFRLKASELEGKGK